MRICKCSAGARWRRPTGFLYCGRSHPAFGESPLGNPFKVQGQVTVQQAVSQYRTWLWGKLQSRDAEVLAALADITPSKCLGCWCCDARGEECLVAPCHTSIIWKAYNWLQTQEELLSEAVLQGCLRDARLLAQGQQPPDWGCDDRDCEPLFEAAASGNWTPDLIAGAFEAYWFNQWPGQSEGFLEAGLRRLAELLDTCSNKHRALS